MTGVINRAASRKQFPIGKRMVEIAKKEKADAIKGSPLTFDTKIGRFLVLNTSLISRGFLIPQERLLIPL